MFIYAFSLFLYRLTSSGGSTSLQELTLLAAARRSAAAAAAAAAAGPMSGMSSSGGGGGPGDLHPAYRLNPYVEHLYSSLHSSPTASLRGLSPLDPRGMYVTIQSDNSLPMRIHIKRPHSHLITSALGCFLYSSFYARNHGSVRSGLNHWVRQEFLLLFY